MKKIILFLSYLILVNIFSISCTEEINIDLNSSDPEIVIEGKVLANGEASIIKITKSVNFDESNDFPKVQNALVELSDNSGNTDTLSEISPGIYSSAKLTGVQGRTYYLSVQAENNIFTSSCMLPSQVSFDSLFVKKTTGPIGGGLGGGGYTTNYEVTIKYNDPANETNFYRFVEIINGEIKDSYIFDDRLSDGLDVQKTLLSFDRELENRDTLKIEMQCIDKSVYEYFNSFGNLRGGPRNSSTPANPYSNIEGAVLGYFSAHTVEVKQVVIQ